MAHPTNREEFKEYVLRKLGKPVLQINVDDDQVDDRIDEALKYYADYHFDASEKTYYKYQVQAQDQVNKYITLPPNIMGAVRIFPISDPSIRAGDLFNIRYQIALNDLFSLTSSSLVPYYMVMEHLQLINQLLIGNQPIRYSRHKQILWIDMDWSKVEVGDYLLVEAYQVIDPDTYTDTWSDRWLTNYATALIKQQWGTNLMKFAGIPTIGGVMFNGEKIKAEADELIQKLEDEMLLSYSLPPEDMWG